MLGFAARHAGTHVDFLGAPTIFILDRRYVVNQFFYRLLLSTNTNLILLRSLLTFFEEQNFMIRLFTSKIDYIPATSRDPVPIPDIFSAMVVSILWYALGTRLILLILLLDNGGGGRRYSDYFAISNH